jgi:hypothetical protein
MDQEFELLRTAPPPALVEEGGDERGKGRDERDMWKLDAPQSKAGEGPLLDPDGKVSSPPPVVSPVPTLMHSIIASSHI